MLIIFFYLSIIDVSGTFDTSYFLVREYMHQNSNISYSPDFVGQLFRNYAQSNSFPTGSSCMNTHRSSEQAVLSFCSAARSRFESWTSWHQKVGRNSEKAINDD